MDSKIYERFANAIVALAPDLPMSENEIQAIVKTHGLEHLYKRLNNQAKEYIEAVEIIERLESPGEQYE